MKKTVKAWALLGKKNNLITAETRNIWRGMWHFEKIIRCTVTYEIPKRKGKK